MPSEDNVYVHDEVVQVLTGEPQPMSTRVWAHPDAQVSESEQVPVTETLERYHPLFPTVPDVLMSAVGAVTSQLKSPG